MGLGFLGSIMSIYFQIQQINITMPAKTATPTLLPLLSLLLLSILLAPTSCQPSPQFSWSSIEGSSYIIGQVYSQNFPYPCNAGWAFSAIDVFNSRMKIRRNASSPDFQISVQVLLSCDFFDFGCMGGEPVSAFKWIKKNWVTDSSCQGYRAQGYTNGLGCSSQLKCQTCQSPTCKPTPNSKLYTVHDYGLISGQTNIMQQIQKYGPVACGINSTGLINYTSGIIKNNGLITNRHDHFVFVYGWGVENGVKFWRCKNSWGTAWGESGYFRVEKGSNVLGIQGSCAWAGPQDTWTDDIRNKTIPNSLPPQPLTYQIPPHLTPIKSSLTPHQCISAWAFSVTQMIADRQSHRTKGQNLIRLSVQGLINCGVGKCSKGGSPIDALIFIQKYGLAQENCQNYLGVDPDKESCSGVSNCAVCQGSVFQYRCSETKNYKRWRILEHGFFTGADNMKNYLYDGPIVCGIFASEEFKKYQGGIFSEISVSPKIDHYVQIVGYGSEEGKNYWLGRNFWGTAWGESSMFRIQMGGNNLGIESKCYYSKGLI